MDWKKIDDFDNYSISSEGQVRNNTGLILKPSNDKDGYLRVCLYKNGKQKCHKVHRLVALAFIPLEAGKDFVDHKDGHPENNLLENLRWANKKENAQNQSMSKNNKSGFKGVRFDKGKWRAEIWIEGKSIYLGTFETIGEAVAVRSAKANEAFGEFTNACERV